MTRAAEVPVLVVSPHFDDAIFSCGAWIAMQPHVTVCTVFAASPSPPVVTDWDLASGFGDSTEAMMARTEEDAAALDEVGALPCRLPFLDAQYGYPPKPVALRDAIVDAVYASGAKRLVMPLGLYHPDHELVHRACIAAWQLAAHVEAFAYEDALYRRMPSLASRRLQSLAERRIHVQRYNSAPIGIDARSRLRLLKGRAVAAYASQLRAIGDGCYDDVFEPERLWALQHASDTIRRNSK